MRHRAAGHVYDAAAAAVDRVGVADRAAVAPQGDVTRLPAAPYGMVGLGEAGRRAGG